jgi:hypothetical protein
MKSNCTLCDFKECPLKEDCARYLEDLDKTNTNHFAFMPYSEAKKKCNFFVQLEIDDIINLLNN